MKRAAITRAERSAPTAPSPACGWRATCTCTPKPSALHADHRGAHREAARRQARRRRSLLPRPVRRDRRRLRRGGRIRPRRNGAPRRGALRHLARTLPFERVPARYFDRPAFENAFVTPDKANAVLRAGLNVRMRDDHPDFPRSPSPTTCSASLRPRACRRACARRKASPTAPTPLQLEPVR